MASTLTVLTKQSTMGRWSSMTMFVMVQALTFLQLIEQTEASFVSDRSLIPQLPFSNHQRQSRQFQRREMNLRNGAQEETESNGEVSAFTSHPHDRISLHEQQPESDEHGNNHHIPHSSTPANTDTHSQYSDDDKIAGATLGDIMSDGVGLQMTSTVHSSSGTTNTSTDSFSSSSSSSLSEQYGITHPLDRMALTANGNLQRLVSSYYDAPVSVVVDSCVLRVVTTSGATGTTTAPMPASASATTMLPKTSIWDRTVHLTVYGGQTFCTAVSVITVHDPLCQQLVQSGKVGLGQLFRYLDLLPEFTLRGAGVGTGISTSTVDVSSTGKGYGGGGFWRDYTLSCAELTCDIHEEFRPGLWNMQPHDDNEHHNGPDSSASTAST